MVILIHYGLPHDMGDGIIVQEVTVIFISVYSSYNDIITKTCQLINLLTQIFMQQDNIKIKMSLNSPRIAK